MAIFIAFLLFYACFDDVDGRANAGDNLWYIPTAISILTEHNTDLTEFQEPLRHVDPGAVWLTDMDSDPRLYKGRGQVRNWYPIGTSLVCLPLVPIGHMRYAQADNAVIESLAIARLCAKILAALSASLMFVCVMQLSGKVSTAWMLTLVFALTTPHFSAHVNGLWSHNAALPFVMLAILLMCGWEGKRVAWSALPLAAGYIIRPDVAMYIAVVGLYVLVHRRRHCIRFALLGAAVGAPFMAWSLYAYGAILPPYYDSTILDPQHFWEAMAGNLVSPNRGLFVSVPLFLFSVAGGWIVFRKRADYPATYRYLSMVLPLHVLLISCFRLWHGGFSYGPRLFAMVLPVLVLLLIPAGQEIRHMRRLTRGALTSAMVVFALWGGFVQWKGATAYGVYHWNVEPNIDLHPGRVWSWSDMQIFRDDPDSR